MFCVWLHLLSCRLLSQATDSEDRTWSPPSCRHNTTWAILLLLNVQCAVHSPWSWTAHATQSQPLFSLTAIGFLCVFRPILLIGCPWPLFARCLAHLFIGWPRPVLVVITSHRALLFPLPVAICALFPGVYITGTHDVLLSSHPHWHHSFSFLFFVNNFSLKSHSKKNKRKGILHIKVVNP